MPTGSFMHTNRLIREKSPYLLQHAHNPVDWYPWGDEAFRKSRTEDKPIFLSIGYSTCHWCHVMERESFENEDIAAVLNRDFVSIKIDREERPDIDRIYMAYVQATTGGGGWPMSVWLTPDLKPFVGGTYFPPDSRYGRAGFPVILERISAAWKEDRAKIIESSENVMRELRKQAEGTDSSGADHVDRAVSDACFQQFRRMFDKQLGGFGNAPKFPRPSVHNFLMRYWKRTGNEEALEMVTATLLAMEKGGMNDQLGGGFHRYSVDDSWFVPHFEKMLYDQAQLVLSYLEAFQATRDEVLAAAARKTLEYVIRDMTSEGGGFYSAEDADSAASAASPREKSEGAFYVWAWQELFELLGSPQALFIGYRYGMESNGNVLQDPHGEFGGRNILFQAHTVEETAHYFDEPLEDVTRAIKESERTMFEARTARPRPHLDDKILTSWNGLMISAFAKAAAILAEPRYLAAANRAADFIQQHLVVDGQLMRRYRDGAAIGAMLDDYAFLIQGLLDLYESSFDFRRLDLAIRLQRQQSALLEDTAGGGFYASAQADAAALMRVKDDYDGAEPGGNSVSLLNLMRLAKITGDVEFAASSRKLIAAYQERITAVPHAVPQMMCALEFDFAPSREIVVAGERSPEMMQAIWLRFDPNRILLAAGPNDDTGLITFRPEIAQMTAGRSATAVYVCEEFNCKQPVSTAEEFARLLN